MNSPEPDIVLEPSHVCNPKDVGECFYCNQVERLITVVQDLSLARNLDAIMAVVRVAARRLTRADGAAFVLRDGEFCFYVDEDAILPLWKGQRFPLHNCIGGWAMRNRQSVIIPDIYSDDRIPFEAYCTTFVKSLVMVPIRTIDPIGAIGAYWATLHHPTATEVRLLQALADTTAVAMENIRVYSELEQRVRDRTVDLESANQRLLEEIQERQQAEAEVRQLSLTDELTGVHNRRGFFLLAEQQLKLANRMHAPYCLLFIDLDGLKQINDTLGHETGDRALVDAAQLLQQTFRNTDIVARLGGDEFAIFVPDCLGDNEVCARLQANVDEFNTSQNRSYQISMSVGSGCFQPSDLSLEQLIAQVDELMYVRKRHKQQTQNFYYPESYNEFSEVSWRSINC